MKKIRNLSKKKEEKFKIQTLTNFFGKQKDFSNNLNEKEEKPLKRPVTAFVNKKYTIYDLKN